MTTKHIILTGAPGSGKTTTAEELSAMGFKVVDEAATHIINAEQAKGVAEPWLLPDFSEKVFAMQKQQRAAQADIDSLVFYDRSPWCTVALAEYLNHILSPETFRDIQTMAEAGLYNRHVFFFESLGNIQATAARTITYEEAQRFGHLHVEVYTRYGFDLVHVPAMAPRERAELIISKVASLDND
jgi:predicted ATPase